MAPAETSYRSFLGRWWPGTDAGGQPPVVFAASSLNQQRLKWLATSRSLNLLIRPELPGNLQSWLGSACFALGQDDRHLRVFSRRGREILPDELASWLNAAVRTDKRHATAHSSPDGRRLILADVAAPNTGRSFDFFADGTLVIGMILSLLENGRNRLPE